MVTTQLILFPEGQTIVCLPLTTILESYEHLIGI